MSSSVVEHRDLVDARAPLRGSSHKLVVAGDLESAGRLRGVIVQRPEVTVEVRVEHEGGTVDHGHRRVEMHHRVGLRQLDRDDGVRLSEAKRPAVRISTAIGGRPLAHPDHHGAVPEDVDVAAFDRRRLVR